jgi:uncharacterized SAM-binding protein YcdF (DUF218 family)
MSLKMFVSYFLLPYPVILTLLVAGLALLWFTKRQRVGKVLVSTGVGLALIFSLPLTSGWLQKPLHRFRPLHNLALADGARWVVVLGGGYSTTGTVPPNGRLSPPSLERLVEGIRLYRALPGTKLVVSGGVDRSAISMAQVMADTAMTLGVPQSDIVLEAAALDTAEEAVLVQSIVGTDRFVLVTSTMHMHRSMRLFEKRGMHPVPAPAGFWPNSSPLPLPASTALNAIERADHEYVGLLWASLRGQI